MCVLTTKEAEREALTHSLLPLLPQFEPDLSLFTADFVGLRVNKTNYIAMVDKIQRFFSHSATYVDSFTTADYIMAFSAYEKQTSLELDDGSQVSVYTVCFACVDK